MSLALANVRVVLVRPSHPGNVGACARAMKNMGLRHLALVEPKSFPSPDANARAAGADDVLAEAGVFPTLDAALAGCVFAIGTSARERAIAWPSLDATEAAAQLVKNAARGPVAAVFGAERTGLTNEELDRCHFVVTIPADPAFSSLNLAAAVQVLSYEIFRAARAARGAGHEAAPISAPDTPLATSHDLRLFYEHLERVLIAIEFLDPANPRKLMRRLTRLFNRAAPDVNEINILRGILTEFERRSGKR
jgi:TrmH family RNA methyltransferase